MFHFQILNEMWMQSFIHGTCHIKTSAFLRPTHCPVEQLKIKVYFELNHWLIWLTTYRGDLMIFAVVVSGTCCGRPVITDDMFCDNYDRWNEHFQHSPYVQSSSADTYPAHFTYTNSATCSCDPSRSILASCAPITCCQQLVTCITILISLY